MTSRFEPKDTSAAFTALGRLAKVAGTTVAGSIEVQGSRVENDYLTFRVGQGVAIPAAELDTLAKELVRLLNAESPSVALRLDKIHFPSGRDLARFCDDTGQDFDQVAWRQEPAA
jgi:hypothetical protein